MSQNLDPNPEEGTEQQEEQEAVDPIALLGQELAEIRKALGLGSEASSSSLLKRLDAIEKAVVSGSPEVERRANLPKTISHSQLTNTNWMRKHGVQLEDIGTRIKIVPDSEG